MSNIIIDLEDYRSKIGKVKSRVFTGRDRGKEVKEKSDINNKFAQHDAINIVIPPDIYSITPSFLEEFLVDIVSKYGIDSFRSKISFENNGYSIDTPLEEALERILQTKNALDK